MEDDSDEYEFAECNMALLKETLGELCARAAPRPAWRLQLSCEWPGEWRAADEETRAECVSAGKRRRSASGSSARVKRARRRSAPPSDASAAAEQPSPPSSRQLIETAGTPADRAHATPHPLADSEASLALVASDAVLAAPAAARWLRHTLTPQLLSGELPSEALAAALVGLAARLPDAVIEHCLLPLAAGEQLVCEQLALRLVSDGLPEAYRTQLVRRLCGTRPLSLAAVPLLLALLPACCAAPDVAGELADSVAAAAGTEQLRGSAAAARLLLALVQRAGHLLTGEQRARLASAAEHGRTALRRVCLAALRRLDPA